MGGSKTAMVLPTSNPGSSYSTAPVNAQQSAEHEIILLGSRTISLDPPMVDALRNYVQQFCRVYGRARLRTSFGLQVAALQRWESGHIGHTMPLRLIERLGADTRNIDAATDALRSESDAVEGDCQDDESAQQVCGPFDSSGVPPRVVTLNPLVQDESAAFGDKAAFAIERWRDLRRDVSRCFEEGSLYTADGLLYREFLYAVELELIDKHGMTVMGAGLNSLEWDEDEARVEVCWRRKALADARVRRAKGGRRLIRRLIDWLLP